MEEKDLLIREELRKAGHRLMAEQLTWGSSGNISARKDEEHILITASGTNLGDLMPEDFVECPIHGPVPPYEKKPSKELPFHLAIYRRRPDIGTVLHATPFYSTLIACSNREILRNCFVESMYYLERVERVPFAEPGSEALAERVADKVMKANVLLLENHGVIVCDANIKEALMALETLEMACRMNVTAWSSGLRLIGPPADRVNSFLESGAYKPRRRWQS